MRFRPPLGKEIIKVIATTEQSDFRGLLYLPPDARGKGLKGGPLTGAPSGWRNS
jgi:hypothetical protein